MIFYLLNKRNYNIELPQKVTINSYYFLNDNKKNADAIFHATIFQFSLITRYKKREDQDPTNGILAFSFHWYADLLQLFEEILQDIIGWLQPLMIGRQLPGIP